MAALNAALTFYLLVTARHQLAVLRDDLDKQQRRHDEQVREQEARRQVEADEARKDLEHMQGLLTGMTDALRLAQTEARQSQQETAKARFDLLAPRCSVAVSDISIVLRGSGRAEVIAGQKKIPRGEIGSESIEVSLTFEIKNWGTDPIFYALGERLGPQGSFVLHPGELHKFSSSFVNSVQWWIEFGEGHMGLDGQPRQRDDGVDIFQAVVPVTSLGGEVTDNHVWKGMIGPLQIQQFDVIVRTGEMIMASVNGIAMRERRYNYLTVA